MATKKKVAKAARKAPARKKTAAKAKAASKKKAAPMKKVAAKPPAKKVSKEKASKGKKPMTTAKTTAKPTAKPAQAKAKAQGLTKKQLQYFKERLLHEKQKVLEEMGEIHSTNLKQSIADQSGEISRYSYHLGDTASLSYGREFSMGLAERQQRYLEQVDDALSRIAEGTYGICKVTGEPIPLERLEEVPVAKYSVKGKELLAKGRR